VVVSNDGERAGTEIAQVYVSDLTTSVTWVNCSLVGFERVTLQPGERRKLQLLIPFERFSLVDAYERRVVEPGEFELMVGGSSRLSQLLRGKFSVAGQAFAFDRIPGVAS
ncbi:MAG TPA: fibronectin type III-like domain-contianing protein, partial [Polyangiaceae bacterium]